MKFPQYTLPLFVLLATISQLHAQYSLSYFKQSSFGLDTCTVFGRNVVETTGGGYLLSCLEDCSGEAGMLVSIDGAGNSIGPPVATMGPGPLVNTGSGGYVNFNRSSFNPNRLSISKFTLGMQQSWMTLFDFPVCNNSAEDIIQVEGSGFAVCGFYSYQSCASPLYESFLVKFDDTGSELWRKSYNHHQQNTEMLSIVSMADGGYSMFGWIGGTANDARDYHLIRTDSDGDTLWTKTFSIGHTDYGYTHMRTSDGGLVLAGVTQAAGNYRVYLMKTDLNGNLLWSKDCYRLGGQNTKLKVEELSNGNIALLGPKWESSFTANTAGYVFITDPSGDSLWSDAQEYHPTDIAVLGDGDIVTTGYKYSPIKQEFEAVHLRYDYSAPVAVSELEASPLKWSIFPNPAQDQVRIESAIEVSHLVVYDLNGRVALDLRPNARTLSINTSDLPQGTYMVTIEQEDGISRAKKMVVLH